MHFRHSHRTLWAEVPVAAQWDLAEIGLAPTWAKIRTMPFKF